MQRKWIIHTLLVGCKMIHWLWKIVWQFILKLKWTDTWPTNLTLGHYSQRNEDFLYSCRKVYMNIHSNFISHSQRPETTERAVCRTGEDVWKSFIWQGVSIPNVQNTRMAQNKTKTNNPVKTWSEDFNGHFPEEDTWMASRCTKGRSPSLAVSRRKSEPRSDLPWHLSAGPFLKKTRRERWRGRGEKRSLAHRRWERTSVRPLRETARSVLETPKTELPRDPAIPPWLLA